MPLDIKSVKMEEDDGLDVQVVDLNSFLKRFNKDKQGKLIRKTKLLPKKGKIHHHNDREIFQQQRKLF